MNQQYNLNDVEPGQHAVISGLSCTGGMRRRLLDIGLVENTVVECIGRSPGGDPSAFLIRGAVIAIRSEDCRNILIQGDNRRDMSGPDKQLSRKKSRRFRLKHSEEDAG